MHSVATGIAVRFMSSYRFYSHDHLGRLVDRHELHCRDDADALSVGQDLNHTYDIEIWLGLRHVARISRRSQRIEANTDTVSGDTSPGSVLEKVRLA